MIDSGDEIKTEFHCLIVDESPVALLGFRLLINGNFPNWKIYTATSIADAKKCLHDASDKLITLMSLDVLLRQENGAALLDQLQGDSPTRSTSTIILSNITDRFTISLCKRLEACGCVSRNSDTCEIIRAIRAASEGEEYFYPEHENPLRGTSEIFHNLTSRQRDLIELLLAGNSNKMIANILHLSYGTVKNYMFQLMRQLSVNTRLELVTKVRESRYQSRYIVSQETMQYSNTWPRNHEFADLALSRHEILQIASGKFRDATNSHLQSKVDDVHTPPHSIESERSVLGRLLLDNSNWGRISKFINESDFYGNDHRIIYQHLVRLLSNSHLANVVTLFDSLSGEGQADEVGGIEYLNTLVKNIPSPANILHFAEIVRDRSVLRKLISATSEV